MAWWKLYRGINSRPFTQRIRLMHPVKPEEGPSPSLLARQSRRPGFTGGLFEQRQGITFARYTDAAR